MSRLWLVLAVAAAAGCGNGGADQEITLSAAASLTDAFEAIGDDFEADNPGTNVAFNFGSSSTLATQIHAGAPVDVYASADTTQMDVLVDAGLIEGEPLVFARNRLEIAVEPANPLGIDSLEDLASPDVTLVLCADTVPCGKFADQALATAGVDMTPASREVDVRATLRKVELGEADAAIVYESDIVAADGRVDGVEIPADENVIATYPIAMVSGSGNEAVAQAFVDAVTASAGQATLEEYGFLAP